MSHLVVKGRRRSAKVQARKRRRGRGPANPERVEDNRDQELGLKRVSRNRFRMLRRSVAAAWRKFDRVSGDRWMIEAAAHASKKAEGIQARALAYGRSRGLAIG